MTSASPVTQSTGPIGSTAPRSVLPTLQVTAVLLLVAPALEQIETVLSPLPGGGSARANLAAITSHTGSFTASVTFGLIATLLYVPMFLGLTQVCVQRTPRIARIAAWVTTVCMLGFVGMRMSQAAQLALVHEKVPLRTAAAVSSSTFANPIGGTLILAFLAGNVVGLLLVATAVWRSRLPRGAAVLFVAFLIADFALPSSSHATSIAAHLLLVAACWWLAVALWRAPATEPGLADAA